jgi:hypothetical protein
MLESKKKMAQSFSDLKVALEKGRGSPEDIFPIFEKGCRDFARETEKVPAEFLNQFLEQVQVLKEKIGQGRGSAIFEQMDVIKNLKKSCHEKFK